MPIPDYQSLMLPVLKIASDGKEHGLSDTIELLASQFKLTDSERRELLPSGRQSRFDNRVGWAKTYLKKAGLLDTPNRGKFCITERGMEALKAQPTSIDRKFLEQFSEFVEFQGSSQTSKTNELRGDEDSDRQLLISEQTPEEMLEFSFQSLKAELASKILNRVKLCSPQFFEKIVVDLILAMGYGGSRKDAGQAIGRTNDGGVDGIIKEDKLGFDIIYVQAKRWEGTVGRPVVQAFAGSLEGFKAKRGVIMTTSQFSREANDYVERIEKRIILIDGEQLAKLMIEHNVGVAETERYILKKIDSDYFEEDEPI